MRIFNLVVSDTYFRFNDGVEFRSRMGCLRQYRVVIGVLSLNVAAELMTEHVYV